MAKAYQEGTGWCLRKRYKGQDIYLSGLATRAKVEKALREEMDAIDKLGVPKGRGPRGTTLAQALQDFGLEHLPRLKGAAQEVRRINKYLQAARLSTILVVPAATTSGMHFEATLIESNEPPRIPNGLRKHRKALMCKTSGSDRLRQILAQTDVASIGRDHIQKFMDALRSDGLAPATLGLERALLRGFFNYAKKNWRWAQPTENPTLELTLPAIHNERERVLSMDEQTLLDAAFDDARTQTHRHVITLLRETAMRASEPLLHARWGQVDWNGYILQLDNGKNGKRNVPLSPVAIDALKALGPGKAEDPIVTITYEALKASMRCAMKRAGIQNFRLHDLRHTAATRMALETGNVYLVKALTGHKTLKMVQRYVNVGAGDAVKFMHRNKEALAAPESTVAQEVVSQDVPSTPGMFDAAQVQDIVSKALAHAMAAAVAGASASQVSVRSADASNTPLVRRAA